ncbi:beta-galactosidase [Candidatus Uhrbacteria bacterium]|nr:beta-galactosidase [Candidatus Uhrbacteria bacterium]
MARKIFLFIALVALALLAILVVSALVLKDTDEAVVTQTLEPQPIAAPEKTTLFGTMLAFNSNEGLYGKGEMATLLMEGWSTLRANQMMELYFPNLETAFQENGELADATGFSTNRDVVGAFVWNVIEPSKGTYDWRLTDATMSAAGEAGMAISAVVQPFASWDQTGDPEAYRERCKAIDFGYYDFNAGPVSDWEAYKTFLTSTVERYDGDGEGDMPGLATRVEAWEIGNEYEGSCGGHEDNPMGYGELLKVSYETIKAADPDALVLNAGALEVTGRGEGPEATKEFWETFFEAGFDQYLDVFNFHYNKERAGAEETPEDWIAHLNFFNALMEDSEGTKPLWVTEFGTYSGAPKASVPPGGDPSQARSLTEQSPAFQSSWFFRYAVIGFDNGLERMFVDLEGSDQSGIGASSLYNQGPGKDGEPRAFLSTLQAMGDVLNGFSAVRQIAEGQYVFSVDGREVYALWAGSLPGDLSGVSLARVGLDGAQTMVLGDDLNYSQEEPVLVWAQ